MGSQFVATTLLVTFSAIILLMARIHQKPICINSQYIEKITFSDSTQVYRCAFNRTVSYSAKFKKWESTLHSEITPFEQWLKAHLRVKSSRIQIQVYDTPTVTMSEGKTIKIWEENLDQKGLLQQHIARLVLKQVYGDLSTVDPLAEFYARAWNKKSSSEYGTRDTYASYQWWKAYQNLGFKKKFYFLSDLPRLSVNQMKVDFNEAKFDYLLVTPNLTPAALTKIDILQKRFPQYTLGIWSNQVLYHMPSRSQLTPETFQSITAHHFIWESCDDLDLQSLIQIPADVRKLLVVRNCDPNIALDLKSYVEKGVEGFAARNPKAAFVRIDLPSLKSRKDFIAVQHKIFDLMSRRQIDDPFFTAFGWQEINLNPKLQIYVPRAYVDAVESFRVH